MNPDIEKRLATLEMRLDLEFKNRALLLEAVTHPSFLNENPGHPVGHNERLEYLGDAVLEIIVSEALFRKYPEQQEGFLTNTRAALVNWETLSPIAKALGIEEALLMAKGERKDTHSRARAIILANAYESVLGAIYLDQGMGASRLFVDITLLSNMRSVTDSFKDSKSELQETIQALFRITPVYRVLSVTGPDHDRNFVMGVCFGSVLIAQANGSNKKDAQKAAAKAALERRDQWDQLMKGGV